MKYIDITIRRNSDSVTRVRRWPWNQPVSTFWWGPDGNMGCDCNRALEFHRAAGEPAGDPECSDGKFTVLSIIDDLGVLHYSEK